MQLVEHKLKIYLYFRIAYRRIAVCDQFKKQKIFGRFMLVNLKENTKIKTAKIENRMKLKKKCNKTKRTNVFKRVME